MGKPFGIGLICLAALVGLYFVFSSNNAEQAGTVPIESAERLARIAAMAESWPKSPDFGQKFDPRDPYSDPGSEGKQAGAAFDVDNLPVADNGAHELVIAYCSGCHSLNIVAQQNASRARWQEMLIWMEEKQGMSKIPAEDEADLLDYLSKEF